jgi:hypothetical protein
MKKNVHQPVALVTGASSGIGLEFSRVMAKSKINLILVARSAEKLAAIANELTKNYGVDVKTFVVDLSNQQELEKLYSNLQEQNLQVDYLINNAGFGDFGYFHEADWNKLEQMINLNITALTRLSYLFVRDMVGRGHGRILNVASTAAFQPGPTMAVYYATKSYVLSLSEAMANELEKTGVTVTCLCPGPTESGFQEKAALGESKLVKGKKLPSAMEVAEFGFDAMMKGKITVIPGLMNAVSAQAYRFLPRNWILKLVRSVQEKA